MFLKCGKTKITLNFESIPPGIGGVTLLSTLLSASCFHLFFPVTINYSCGRVHINSIYEEREKEMTGLRLEEVAFK